MKDADLHIFIPAYNEAASIGEVVRDIKAAGWEHIHIVDDGSTDATRGIAKNMGANCIRHALNRGAGAATQTAIEYARKKAFPLVLFMDADGQHSPDDITRLMKQMRETGADIIIGSRFLEKNEIPPLRKMYNHIGNWLVNIWCSQHYTDTQSGLRLLNAHALQKIDLTIDNFAFCSEMILLAERAGLQVEEVPISVIYTPYSLGKGQGLRQGLRTIAAFWWRIIFS